MQSPPEFPGLPGALVSAVSRFKAITNIFPPAGLGLGAGIGLGCGFGWPLRSAHGPPRAVCGPAIAVGIGVGYGQGFGRRFGKDQRAPSFKKAVARFEHNLDLVVVRFLALIGAGHLRK